MVYISSEKISRYFFSQHIAKEKFFEKYTEKSEANKKYSLKTVCVCERKTMKQKFTKNSKC